MSCCDSVCHFLPRYNEKVSCGLNIQLKGYRDYHCTIYFVSSCIDNDTQIWSHSKRNRRDWRLRPKFSNSTNLYTVELSSVNGIWYPFCARNDGFHSYSPPLTLCQTVSDVLTNNTSSTHVAVQTFRHPEMVKRELTSLPGNCSMYGMVQLQFYCLKGKFWHFPVLFLEPHSTGISASIAYLQSFNKVSF